MAEDIWDKKPNRGKLSSFKGGIISPHFTEIYDAEEMDAFHEKLKSSFDESMADCHHSLELVAKKLGAYREKAEKWDNLKPETKTILEIATEYSYDDVMAGRLSPEGIKTLLDEAFWEHGLQKGTWILDFHKLKNRFEAVRSWQEDIEMDPDDRYRLEKILEGEN